MRMTALQDKSFDTLYYYCQHESGLRIYVYPFKGFRSTYAVIGTKFGSVKVKKAMPLRSLPERVRRRMPIRPLIRPAICFRVRNALMNHWGFCLT